MQVVGFSREKKADEVTEDDYFDAVCSIDGGPSRRRLKHQMNFMYHGIDFRGLRVLDIGGGRGLHSFYAAAKGAAYILNLEPEDKGSSHRATTEFAAIRNALNASNVDLCPETFQAADLGQGPFDLIILQDCVNHLDEDACIALRRDREAQAKYRDLFAKVSAAGTLGATVVLSDCSSSNLYPLLGLKNPFDAGIEWHKHQPPWVWSTLLKDTGFTVGPVRWQSPSKLGRVGAVFFANAAMSYLFTSQFVLTASVQRT